VPALCPTLVALALHLGSESPIHSAGVEVREFACPIRQAVAPHLGSEPPTHSAALVVPEPVRPIPVLVLDFASPTHQVAASRFARPRHWPIVGAHPIHQVVAMVPVCPRH
jgi:hypothetical protein